MRKRIVVSLLLIVLLPIALLAWLGQRMAHSEQQVLEAHLRGLVNSQLAGMDGFFQNYFQAIQDGILQQAARWDGRAETLTQVTLAVPQVRQVLLIGADGQLAYPQPSESLGWAQKDFLQRISAILANPASLAQGAALARRGDPAAAGSSFVSGKQAGMVSMARNDTDSQPDMGWYVWHWNAQLHHMFWWRDRQGRLVGFELAPVAVVSDIIAALPASAAQADGGKTLTRLVGGNGQVLYEWGDYRLSAGDRSLAVWPLSHPLGNWRLEYFAPALQGGTAAASFSVLASVLMVAVALVGLAIYLYREHTREMRLAQQRVNFVNQVSHELKTPLTNVRLYAELLEGELMDMLDGGEVPGADRARKYIGILTGESLRLSRLIADVLSFGQLHRSQVRLNRQWVDVDEIVRGCIATFLPALSAKGLAVQFDAQAPRPVLVDPQALEQILNNLLSNGEKYAQGSRAIHLRSEQHGDTTLIEVRDFGPGIPASEHERIFEPFYRISSRLTDGVAGTGIGLDIARRLARLHGGDVVLVEVDAGACFRVTLDTPPAHPAPARTGTNASL